MITSHHCKSLTIKPPLIHHLSPEHQPTTIARQGENVAHKPNTETSMSKTDMNTSEKGPHKQHKRDKEKPPQNALENHHN